MSEWAQAWVDAWNSHDPERVASLFAEDGTLESMGAGPRFAFQGHEDIKAYARALHQFSNDQTVALVSGLVSEDRFVVEFVETTTNTGPIGRRTPPTNKRYTCPGVAIGRLDSNGKIREERDYMDRLDLFMQLGLLADPLA
jgi:steroid delta-isomerase-like uncharacterized protein